MGQTEAVEEVSAALRCVMSGLTDPARPVASFLFGGRSGSGKALLAMKVSLWQYIALHDMPLFRIC